MLLATGHEDLNQILRVNFKNHEKGSHFKILEHNVVHQKYLLEITRETHPDIILFHDYHFQSQYAEPAEREKEWIEQIETLRREFDDDIRVVFLCERSKYDPFLGELVTVNVLDIYPTRKIDLSELIESLLSPPKYSRVAAYRDNLKPKERPVFEEDTNDDEPVSEDVSYEGSEYASEDRSKNTKERIQEKGSIIQIPKIPIRLPKWEKKPKPEKIVEQKIINKQVIKKQYRVTVQQSVQEVVGISIPKKLVIIGGLNSCVGSTFISHLLVHTIASYRTDVTYIENPFVPSYSYDLLFGDENAPDYISPFYTYYHRKNPSSLVFEGKNTDWKEEDHIRWIVKHPIDEPVYTEEQINFDDFTKVLLSDHSTVTIIDIGNHWDKEIFQDLLDIADHIFLVIEPDISKMQRFEEVSDNKWVRLNKLTIESEKCKVIGNRFTKTIAGSDPVRKLFPNGVIPVSAFSSDAVFQAQFEGKSIWNQRALREKISHSMDPLIKELLPPSFLKKRKKRLFRLPKFSISTD